MRFAKPFVVTLASAAVLALPLSGAALADARQPQPAATAEAPQPTYSNPAVPQDQLAMGRDAVRAASLKVSVDPGRVRAGGSYEVTIAAKGLHSRTAIVISPEGRRYRVALSGGSATKTLTVPPKARPGSETVTVKVGNKVATAAFEVVGARKHQRDDRRHEAK
ncbi:hypothetical protein [Nonomuraea sp. B19D2]|uniref:hypothetical protein n=1 Tax=Nonomuraea sp. B19D2 TaxID=3159561 RepID=UPI0032DBD976